MSCGSTLWGKKKQPNQTFGFQFFRFLNDRDCGPELLLLLPELVVA